MNGVFDGFALRQAQGERKNLQAITWEVSLLNLYSRIKGSGRLLDIPLEIV